MHSHCFKSFSIFSFVFQFNVLSSDIIYESENLSNTTDEEIQYGSDLSVSDSGNSFENKDEEHSVFPTASRTEMLFLVGERSKFVGTIRYNSTFLENQSFCFYNFFVLHLCI